MKMSFPPTMNDLKKNWAPIALVLVLAYCYMNQINPLEKAKETFSNITTESQPAGEVKVSAGPGAGNPQPNDEEEMEYGLLGDKQEVNVPSCAQFVSSNLLPKDDPKLDASFTEFSPAKDLQGQDFIDGNKYAIGMQSQTLRNANHQLRSDPPILNTMECATPWNNTTIGAEERRPLSIGSQ